jgi:hypothetical protein
MFPVKQANGIKTFTGNNKEAIKHVVIFVRFTGQQ